MTKAKNRKTRKTKRNLSLKTKASLARIVGNLVARYLKRRAPTRRSKVYRRRRQNRFRRRGSSYYRRGRYSRGYRRTDSYMDYPFDDATTVARSDTSTAFTDPIRPSRPLPHGQGDSRSVPPEVSQRVPPTIPEEFPLYSADSLEAALNSSSGSLQLNSIAQEAIALRHSKRPADDDVEGEPGPKKREVTGYSAGQLAPTPADKRHWEHIVQMAAAKPMSGSVHSLPPSLAPNISEATAVAAQFGKRDNPLTETEPLAVIPTKKTRLSEGGRPFPVRGLFMDNRQFEVFWKGHEAGQWSSDKLMYEVTDAQTGFAEREIIGVDNAANRLRNLMGHVKTGKTRVITPWEARETKTGLTFDRSFEVAGGRPRIVRIGYIPDPDSWEGLRHK